MGTSEKDIAKFCPTANMKAGLSLIGGQVKSAESQIVKWLIQNKII